jgi:GYF domain 2
MKVYINRNGENSGPFDLEEVKSWISSNNYKSDDLICPEGETGWKNIEEFFGIKLHNTAILQKRHQSTPIKEGLPDDLMNQLMPNESVYYLSNIAFEGVKGSNQSIINYWIALSNNRVLYKARVFETTGYVEKDGILPFDKISFIEVSQSQTPGGCNQPKLVRFDLRISTSGGTIVIPIPTKEKGYEIRTVFSELSQQK